ncbi:3-oxoacyl-[acyl-carrier-protein] synthase III C-terminal domain-containing protein [Dyella sp.]|uniref:3-oxoacyl-[acyl-carrier-protein] synthase III C-terminal domain-containing protein n=1 Tax=Dyella sp. TaxID=1869338 RepID=UPI002ED1AFBE
MAVAQQPLSIRIAGTGEHVAARRVTSDELDTRWRKPSGWTQRHSGVLSRFFAADGETTSSMAASAARQALAAAGLEPGDLDAIVSACSVMEQAIPCTAVLIQRALGLGGSGIPSFDINATCLSFIAALDMISAAMAIGRYRRVLLVSSEVASAGLNWDDPVTAMLFGDGAAAVVLEHCEGASSQLLGVRLETYADGAELCQVRSGGTRIRLRDDPEAFRQGAYFEMHGPATYRMAARLLPPFLERLFECADVSIDGLSCIVPHQASMKGLAHLESALQLPAGMLFRVLAMRGNQMAASIPVALHQAIEAGRIRRGDTIALVGSGAGLSFGGAVLKY